MGKRKIDKNGDEILTSRERAFCHAYMQYHSYSEAYKRVYDASGMQRHVMYRKSYLLSNRQIIKDEIERLKQESIERNRITIDELVVDLANMVRFDPAEMYKEDGSLKSIHDMPKSVRQMISSIDVRTLNANIGNEKIPYGEIKKVNLMNKLDAIEKLMKHLGGYEKDNKQKAAEVTMYQLPSNNRD